MKYFLSCVVMFSLIVTSSIGHATDTSISWNNNPASDNVEFYAVFICTGSPTCVISTSDVDAGNVVPPTDGSLPSFLLPTNTVGAALVTANNSYGSSLVSPQISFDTTSPSSPVPTAPTGLALAGSEPPPPPGPTTLLNAATTTQSSAKLSVVSNGVTAKSVTITVSGTWSGAIHLHQYDSSGASSSLLCNGQASLISDNTYTCAISSTSVSMDVFLISITSGAVTVTALPNF